MLQNLDIGKRLAVVFAAVIVLFLRRWQHVDVCRGAVEGRGRDQDAHVRRDRPGRRAARQHAEHGNRHAGFLLSGNDGNLAPWTDGQKKFDAAWAALKTLTADNPAQQTRLVTLKRQRDEFVAVADGLIGLRRQVSADAKPVDALLATFSLGKDKSAMDGFRATETEFEDMERRLLEQRAAAADRLRTANTLTTLIGSLLAVCAAAGFGLWITRSITATDRAGGDGGRSGGRRQPDDRHPDHPP